MTSVELYEQQPIDQAGVVRAWPTSWTVETYDSGAIAVAIRFAVMSKWSEEHKAWSDTWPTGWYVEARSWLVKKGGELNSKSVQALQECGLWNGDWDAFGDQPPSVVVHVTAEEETYEGKVRFRGSWINPDAAEPRQRGSFTPASPELLHQLRSRFGPATRAIAGGKPAGAPGAPPARAVAPGALGVSSAPAVSPARPAAPASGQMAPPGHPGATRPPQGVAGSSTGPAQHRPAAQPGAGGPPAGARQVGPPTGAQGGPRPPAANQWPATQPTQQRPAPPVQHGEAYEGDDPTTDEQPPF